MKLLLFLFLTESNAQFFNSGIIAGFNFSQIDGDQFDRSIIIGGFDKFGFNIGGFTNTELSKNTTLQFEVYYTNKGSFNSSNHGTIYFQESKISLNYLEIPLLINVNVSQIFNTSDLKFEVGMFYGKLLDYRIEDQYGEVPKSDYDQFNKHPLKKSDSGLLVGFHYSLSSHIVVNYRIKRSVIPIRTVTYPNNNYQQEWYNFETNISLRYQFGG